MAELNNGGADATNRRFTVDSSYLRQQANEAFWTFVAPLSGVYGAVVGGDHGNARSNGRKPDEQA